MAFAWTPPAVLHGVTPTPGLKTPVVSEVRIAVVMLAGSNDGLLAQSSVARRLPPAADSAPGVVANCTNLLPTNPAYYTTDLLFDNVLIGDYQQLGGSPSGTGAASVLDAAGNPMVHIRAVPEGGGAGANVPTGLPYTFYDRPRSTAAAAWPRDRPSHRNCRRC